MKKICRIIGLVALSLLILAGCRLGNFSETPSAPVAQPSASEVTPPAPVVPQKSTTKKDTPAKEVSAPASEVKTAVEQPAEPTLKTRSFSMVARKWEFVPATIEVDEGDTVLLTIKSEDVSHGFFLSAFNVKETLSPGKTVNIEFVADKKGTFSFVCSVFCGDGHSRMAGTLVVK